MVCSQNLKKLLDKGQKVDIIDVRNPTEFSIVHLPGSRNVPLRTLLASPSSYLSPDTPTIVTCRLGNDSKIGAEALREALVAQRRKGAADKWKEHRASEVGVFLSLCRNSH